MERERVEGDDKGEGRGRAERGRAGGGKMREGGQGGRGLGR